MTNDPNGAPNELIVSNFSDVVSAVMNEAQFRIISGRTPKSVIKKRPGRGGRVFKYVPHGYVTALLNKAFGFDWDFELLPVFNGSIYEITEPDPENSRPNPELIVFGQIVIRIHNPQNIKEIITEIKKTSFGRKELVRGYLFGDALKAAAMDCKKKAATELGIALDLYWEDREGEYIPPEPATVSDIGEFLAFCLTDKGLSPIDVQGKLGLHSVGEIESHVLNALGVGTWAEIGDLEEALEGLGL